MSFGVKHHIITVCVLLGLASSAAAINVGQEFPDFALASANLEYGQRLHEQRGNPVLLLVLERCKQCEKQLLDFQFLASSYAVDDLVSWVIWQPYKKDLPPNLHIPVLNAQSSPNSGWDLAVTQPTLLFIDRDGVLVQQETGSLKALTEKAQKFIPDWMSSSQARPEGR